MKSLKQGKSNKSQMRMAAKSDYGSSANVRESTAQSYSKPKGGKAKAGKYASYS